MLKILATVAAVVGVTAVVATFAMAPVSPEQIEQQRIQTEQERAKQAEAAERERIRQTYLAVEIGFGKMIMAHTRNYNQVKAQAAQNGMISTDGLMAKRDAEAMAWFKSNNFKFERWEAKIVKIDGPSDNYCPKGMVPCINFTVKMTTADGLVLRASAAQSPQFVTMMTARRPGDVLVISGRFVQRYANNMILPGEQRKDRMPSTPREMEVSVTESGSMEDPEYRIVIDSMHAK